jgi:hypothetical protein
MVIDAKHIVPLAITAFSSNDTDTAATSVLSPSVISNNTVIMTENHWWNVEHHLFNLARYQCC